MVKALTPWSQRITAGASDEPVGSKVPVVDELAPTIDTGFIDTTGTYIGRVGTDAEFTRFGPETLATGAAMDSDTINLVEYDVLIIAFNSDGSHSVEIDLFQPTAAIGPYAGMDDLGGIGVGAVFSGADTETDGAFVSIVEDGAETATDTWKFWRVGTIKGLTAVIRVINNDVTPHTIHGAYLRVA